MVLEGTDPSSPSAWKLFNYTHSLPNDAPVGTYNVTVKGIESNDVNHTNLVTFYVPTGVSVKPNNTGAALPGTSINYTHYINSTGNGADIFEITVNSQNGFNVTLYDSGDQMMAYDSDGDGTWEWVNLSYDTNGDGTPDTGILLPGESYQVRLKVDIPIGFLGSDENTTITATSAAIPTIFDSAWDYTLIPEFSDLILPIVVMLLLFFVVKRHRDYKRKKKGSKSGKEGE